MTAGCHLEPLVHPQGNRFETESVVQARTSQHQIPSLQGEAVGSTSPAVFDGNIDDRWDLGAHVCEPQSPTPTTSRPERAEPSTHAVHTRLRPLQQQVVLRPDPRYVAFSSILGAFVVEEAEALRGEADLLFTTRRARPHLGESIFQFGATAHFRSVPC